MTSVDSTSGTASGEEPPRPSRRSRLLKSLRWTTAGHGLTQIIRLGSSIVLTRFLVPEVYGVMELVWVVMTGLQLMSDVGIETCIIHSKRGDDERFLNTAWTLQVARGALLLVSAALLGYPMAIWFRQPELTYLIPAIGLTALVGGFNATSIQTEQRRINIAAVIQLELVVQVVAVGVQVAVAVVWPTVWALVFGAWAASIVKLVASFWFLDSMRHRFDWDRSAITELMRYGRWIFGSTAVHFLASNGDRLILARLLEGIGDLGVYGIALRLKNAAQALHTRLVSAVVFPALAEKNREYASDDPNRVPTLSAMFYKARFGLDAVFVTGAGGLMALGQPVVSVLYDAQYHAAGWILQILTVQLATAAVLGTPETLLTAVGYTKYGFFRSITRAVWVVAAVPTGWYLGEFEGLVWAVSLTEVPALVVIWWAMIRHGFFDYVKELRAVGFYAAGFCAGYVVKLGLEAIFGSF